MTKLNGDSQLIVNLLAEKIKAGNNQINKRMDDFIASNEKLLHSHCKRIRGLEAGQNINKTKLGGLIAVVATLFTIIANFVWNTVSKS